jgi:hypothetical protein
METGDCFTIAISKSKSKGKRYYVNTETGLSRWGLPIYDESTELKVEKKVSGWEVVTSVNVAPRRVYFRNPSEGISQWNPPPKIEHVEDEPLADGWKKRLSKCKNIYYFNEKENKSQWEIPKATSEPKSSPIGSPEPKPKPKPIAKPKPRPKHKPVLIAIPKHKPKPKPTPKHIPARIPSVEFEQPRPQPEVQP